MTSRLSLAAFAAFALAAGVARSEVVDVQSSGFTVRETAVIAAPPGKVWDVLVRPAAWWAPEHTFSHDARNLTLTPRAGGTWDETLPGGGSVRHLVVVYVMPPSILRLEGALGPMQALGAAGHLTYELKPQGAGTAMTMTYDLGGHNPGGFAGLAPVVDRVLGEQLARLKTATETGKTP